MMNINGKAKENETETEVKNDEFIIDFLSEDESGVSQDKIY
jgi:hypothetical protein